MIKKRSYMYKVVATIREIDDYVSIDELSRIIGVSYGTIDIACKKGIKEGLLIKRLSNPTLLLDDDEEAKKRYVYGLKSFQGRKFRFPLVNKMILLAHQCLFMSH